MSTNYISWRYPKPVSLKNVLAENPEATVGPCKYDKGCHTLCWPGGYLHLEGWNPKRKTITGFDRFGDNDPTILEETGLFVSEHDDEYFELLGEEEEEG